MILIYAVILIILIALAFRRDLTALTQLPYRARTLLAVTILLLATLQLVAVIFAPAGATTPWQAAIIVLSQLVLLVFLLLNHHIRGFKVIALGAFLNLIVLVANGGWMPITPETYRFIHPHEPAAIGAKPSNSKNIILPRPQTNVWILSDIILIPAPHRWYAVSIGDLLLTAGVALFVFQADLGAVLRPSPFYIKL